MSSAQAAEEGLALLIVSGMQRDSFTRVDADLTDLTAALKVLAQTDVKG